MQHAPMVKKSETPAPSAQPSHHNLEQGADRFHFAMRLAARFFPLFLGVRCSFALNRWAFCR